MQNAVTFGVIFVLKQQRIRNNIAPVYARITVNGKRALLSVKRRIEVNNWNSDAGRGKGTSIKVRQLNTYLDQVYRNLLEAHKQLLDEKRVITAQAVKARYLGTDDTFKKLSDILEYHSTHMKNVLKPGTLKNYRTTEKYLYEFLEAKLKISDIFLKELNYRFIVDFEYFLRTYKSKTHRPTPSNNGVMKHLERLKKLINLAQKLEWIHKDPFAKYSLKFDKVEREFLNENELEQLIDFTSERKALVRTCDIFIFSCYTGLSYIDVKHLTKEHIVQGIDGNQWIYTAREKTATPVKIPILPKAEEILNKYREQEQKTGLLLPVYSNQKTNQYLKDIAKELNIRKKFTFHTARHTFATTVTLSNGVPIETVSKLLGHSKLSTTQIYARVIERKVSEDMEILRNKMNQSNEIKKEAN